MTPTASISCRAENHRLAQACRMRAVGVLFPAALAGPLILPDLALADQSAASGSGKPSASARIDFRIVIPPVMVLSFGPKAVAAKTGGSGLVPGVRSMTKPGGVHGANLQSNMRAAVLSQDPGRPGFLTAASP